MDKNEIVLGAVSYTDWVLELDPIGAGDLRADFVLFVQNLHANGEFTSYVDAWEQFNEQFVKPVYRLDIPAVAEPPIV